MSINSRFNEKQAVYSHRLIKAPNLPVFAAAASDDPDDAQTILSLEFGNASDGRHPAVIRTLPATFGSADILRKAGLDGFEVQTLICRSQNGRDGEALTRDLDQLFIASDHLVLFWHDGRRNAPVKAAEFENGELTVHDRKAFDAFVSRHEAQRSELERQGVRADSFAYIKDGYFVRAINDLVHKHDKPGPSFEP